MASGKRPYKNKRTFPRYDFRAGISIRPTEDSPDTEWAGCISQNLSMDGINILYSKILVPGDTVYITIPMFEEGKQIVVSGSVEWVGVDDLWDDSPYWVKAGIMFSDMAMKKKKALTKVLLDRRVIAPVASRKPANKIDFIM